MNIELKKTSSRGDRSIVVDGVIWGVARMEGHGCHGPSYWFAQMGQTGAISEPYTRFNGQEDFKRVTVSCKRQYEKGYRLASGNIDPRTTERRILDEAKRVIEVGLLKHPDAVVQARKEALARWAQAKEQQATEQREKDVATVMAILQKHNNVLNVALIEELAEAIENGRSE
jgi:anti-sigma28 factor (negative regulator of flagellin synthesis)